VNSNAASLTLKAATVITQHPQPQTVAAGGTATFTAAATGDGTISYQWQKNGANLANGGHYGGVTTATLTVSSADSSDAADYRCVITAGCGGATSNPASLAIEAASVPGDFDHDNDVDQEDFGHLQHCLDTVAPPTDPECADANLDRFNDRLVTGVGDGFDELREIRPRRQRDLRALRGEIDAGRGNARRMNKRLFDMRHA
jgi:hypothetical protein